MKKSNSTKIIYIKRNVTVYERKNKLLIIVPNGTDQFQYQTF